MFQDEFEKLINDYPETVNDKRKFTGLLKDSFPDNPMQINLIGSALALGIVQDIQNCSLINNSFAYRFVKRMVDELGVSRLNADWAVSVWCVCYGQNILKKECEIKISKGKSGTAPAIAADKDPGSNKKYNDLFRYAQTTEGYGISGFSGQSNKTIVFPNKYNGATVKEIMADSFSGSDVENIVMSEGITVINERAFKGCTTLKQAVFSGTLEQIGQYAFSETGFKKIIIPQSVYWIGRGAFSQCKQLESVEFGSGMGSIPEEIFKGCDALTDIKLPGSIDSIGGGAFEDCISLQNITIPETVKDIGENAFTGVHPEFMIMCHRLSAAEQYARSCGIKFQIIY